MPRIGEDNDDGVADWEAADSDEWDCDMNLDGLQDERSMRPDFAQQADWDDAVSTIDGLHEVSSSIFSKQRKSTSPIDRPSFSTVLKKLQGSIPQAAGTVTTSLAPTTPRSSRSCDDSTTAGTNLGKSNNCETPRRYKWDVKPGGSYVPEAAPAMRMSEMKDSAPQQRKWEVKFAPHVATASRRTNVMIADVQTLMDQYQDASQLRTAVGGVSISPSRKSVNTTQSSPGNNGSAPPAFQPGNKFGGLAQQNRLQGLQADFADSPIHSVKKEKGAERSRITRASDHYSHQGQQIPGSQADILQTSITEGNMTSASNTNRRPLPEGKSADRIWQPEDFEECYAHDMVDGLLQMLMSTDATLSAKAAAALCNLCSESEPNREQVIASGALSRLIDMLENPIEEVPFMQSAAAACLCNLAANSNSKVIIAESGAVEVLVNVLRSRNTAAAAQAAGALWSLCVDNDNHKQLVSDAGAIPHLVQLLHSDDKFTVSQAAGALSECSIRNDRNKIQISQAGTIPYLVDLLKSEDQNVRRLASCAICNVCANNDGNKRQAREAGALPILVQLLDDAGLPVVLTPIAGAVCNLSMKNAENKKELIRLGAIEVLRKHTNSDVASLRGNAIAALNQLEGNKSSS